MSTKLTAQIVVTGAPIPFVTPLVREFFFFFILGFPHYLPGLHLVILDNEHRNLTLILLAKVSPTP